MTSFANVRVGRWEVATILRKLLLSLITKGIIIKNSAQNSDSSLRQALCNMTVLVIACTAQARFMPFAHGDANVAELGLLLCSVLLILVGMGTREVRNKKTRQIIDDPAEIEVQLTTQESGAFYVVIYVVMGCTIGFTLCIILRRLGSLRHQLLMGRKRKWQRQECSDDEDDEDDGQLQDGALPDEIAALVNKSRIDAATAWFNEKENDRHRKQGSFMRLMYLCRNEKALMSYRTVHTNMFLHGKFRELPFPGQISQLKKRLSRKLGVIKVAVDEENCTVLVEHDLSVCSAPPLRAAPATQARQELLAGPSGGGSVRFNGAFTVPDSDEAAANELAGKRQAAADELLKVVNSVDGLAKSLVYRASEDGGISSTSWGTSSLPSFVGGLLVILHQVAGVLDCSYVTTIPMNCSTYKQVFGVPTNSSFHDNSSMLLPAPGWNTLVGIPNNDIVTCNSSDTNGTYFEARCSQLGTRTLGCKYNSTSAFHLCDFKLDYTFEKHERYHEGSAYSGSAPFTEDQKLDARDLLDKYMDKNKPPAQKTTYTCLDKTAGRKSRVLGLELRPWAEASAQNLLCNCKRTLLMLLAICICSLPLAAVVAVAGWKKWFQKQRVVSTSVIAQDQSVLPQICALVAVTMSALDNDFEGAAAIAVLSNIVELISKHALNKAAKAIDAAIARVDQKSAERLTVRAMATDDEKKQMMKEVDELKEYLRDIPRKDDGNKCCKPGPGRGTIDTVATVYSVLSVLAAACLVSLPWIAELWPTVAGSHGWRGNSDAVLLRQIAAVLLVSASPRAFLMSKTGPFWCSVAKSARQGFLTKESCHVERFLLDQSDDGSSADQQQNIFMQQHIGRTCKKTSRQNLVISVVGRLATLCTLATIVWHSHQQDPARAIADNISKDLSSLAIALVSPWYALLVELFVASILALNSTRCVFP